MKLARIFLFGPLIIAFFAAVSQVLASPAADPKQTPGAKATEKAIEHATKQPGGPKGKPENYRGQILDIGPGSLTLTLSDGSSVTVGLAAETRIKIPAQKGVSLAALQPGMNVMVQARRAPDGALTARTVMVIPGKPTRVHRVGTVTAYSPGDSISIQAHDGQTHTFALAADLKILPPERSGELAVGARVTIIAPRVPGSLTWTARGVVVHPATEMP
jgi:hypothetical protein